MNLYKMIYEPITGRPFTYVLRDLYHKLEWFWIVGLVSCGVWMGHHFDWVEVLKCLGIFTVGYIAGHLFWGRDYIPNQDDD